MNESSDFHEKYSYCKEDILIYRDYYLKKENKTVFSCENCAKKENLEKKFHLISKKKDNIQNYMANKFQDFINKNGKMPENDFYKDNLAHIQLFAKFTDYLIFLRTLYKKDNERYKIISNFLDYLENYVDSATQNIKIYDLYHFNKEAIIYSYCNKKKKRFLSSSFNKNYRDLLNNCKKQKFLSLRMLEYLYRKYYEDKLANKIEYNIMKSEYFKVKKIDIGNEIYLEAFALRMKYLDFKSLLAGLENNSEIMNLKSTIIKLEEELLLDKYINSFHQIPGQFSILRKSASLILDKIIRNNQQKFNFIYPSETIINSTLYLISTIKKQIFSNKKKDVVKSINTKLKDLQDVLEKYKYKKSGKGKIECLNLPIIILSDEEKLFLAKNLKNESEERKFTKIKVSNNDDKELEFIVNYLFELRDTTSKTIHVDDKEKLKFYSFDNAQESLPQANKDDDLGVAINKIKTIVENTPKYSEVTYGQLIDFLFNLEKHKFYKMDKKIDYLLSFLNLKLNKLSEIKDNYKKMKGNLDIQIKKIQNLIEFEADKNYYNKYAKFINKYTIKINSKEIFEYLNNILQYIFCLMEEEKEEEEKEEDNSVDEKKEFINMTKIFKQKEEEWRKKITDLFEKDQKFISYIHYYLSIELKKYFEKKSKDMKVSLTKLKNNIEQKTLLNLKLEKIKDIILSLKLYNFDIKTHFQNFAEENGESIPKKLLKTGEGKSSYAGIKNFNVFINKIKGYIGDSNQDVEITGREPSQFVLQLFLQKVGLNWS